MGAWPANNRRMRHLLRLLFGILILSFMAGSTSAALACVDMPAASARAAMPADCPDQNGKMTKHDGAVACVPMCAALAPGAAPVVMPAPTSSCEISNGDHAVVAWNAKPEPPPPRAG